MEQSAVKHCEQGRPRLRPLRFVADSRRQRLHGFVPYVIIYVFAVLSVLKFRGS
jgi:hypothetical protein